MEFSAFISTITPVLLPGTSTAFAWNLNVSPWWWIARIPLIGPTNQPIPYEVPVSGVRTAGRWSSSTPSGESTDAEPYRPRFNWAIR
jgi:hypothetical protein